MTGESVVAPETILPPFVAVQTYVKPAPTEEPAPLSVSVGLAQVSVGGVTTTAVGGVVLEVTVPVAVLVQPLLSVTVTVNGPACA